MTPTILSESSLLRLYQRGCVKAGRTLGTWRFVPYLTDKLATVECFDGKPFAIDLRDPVGIQILLHGFEESAEREAIGQLLRPNAVCLDVGANVGVWARWLAFKYPRGSIHSFEPSASTFHLLTTNTAGFSNIKAMQKGCGQNESDACLSTGSSSGMRHVAPQGETVAMTRLDSLGFDNVDFIKIDVEGLELDVLKGAETIIRSHQPVILFEYAPGTTHRYGYTLDDLTAFLTNFGYTVTRFPETNNYLARPGSRI